MKQKTVLIAGLIGLLFGFLFAGTLGISFFGSEDSDSNVETRTALKKDAEAFRIAYNLDESIYLPIYGDDVAEKLENKETFILYIGRDTCPYCQQHVPNLMEAALNNDFTVIYHIDTIDSSNSSFLNAENITSTPTTYFVKDGVIVNEMVGFRTTTAIEDIITDTLT